MKKSEKIFLVVILVFFIAALSVTSKEEKPKENGPIISIIKEVKAFTDKKDRNDFSVFSDRMGYEVILAKKITGPNGSFDRIFVDATQGTSCQLLYPMANSGTYKISIRKTRITRGRLFSVGQVTVDRL